MTKRLYLLFFLIYFCQGFAGLSSEPIFFWLKETLGLSVRQIDYYGSILVIPWCIKPLWGLLGDYINLFGYNRKGWLILDYIGIISICFYIYFFGLTLVSFIVLELLLAMFFAINDVNVDGLGCEYGQKYDSCEEIQSVQQIGANTAAVLIGVFGGVIAEYLDYRMAFLAVGIGMLMMFIVFLWSYVETKTVSKFNNACFASIWSALKNKQLMISLAFLFVLWFAPSAGTGITFKLRDGLGLSKLFIGVIGSIGSVGAIAGGWLFYKYSKRIKISFKNLLYYMIVLSAFSTLAYLYLPNATVVIIYSIIFGFFGMISQIIVLTYCAKITPKYAEAFCFALIMSILNVASLCSKLTGGWLYPLIGLNWLIIISALSSLLCLVFIPFLNLNKIETSCSCNNS